MANWLSVGVFVRSTVYPAEQGDALKVNKCIVQSREEKVIIYPLPVLPYQEKLEEYDGYTGM